MTTTLQSIPESKLECLTADERLAYERYERSGKPGLSVDYSTRLYDLFVRGVSSSDIVKLNPGLTLGQVIKARVEGNWDEQRSRYLAEVLTNSSTLLKQTAAESLEFLSIVLAAAHKEQGEKLKKFLATGDPKDLGEFRITNMKAYQTCIETIAKLIGADQKKNISHTHRIVGNTPAEGESEESQNTGIIGALPSGKISPVQADALRKALEATQEK